MARGHGRRLRRGTARRGLQVHESERGSNLRLRLLLLGLTSIDLRHPLVVFDLDGTLVDSLDDLAAAVNAALESSGLGRLPTETVAGFIGNGMRMLVGRSVHALDPDAANGVITDALSSFQRHYREHCLDRTALYPGIEGLLRALAARGHRLAVLTNKPRGFSEEILGGLDVAGLFGSVIGGDDLPTRKPDPAGLLSLVEGAGVDRDAAILVGDSPVDIETARNAGVASCGVTWGFNAEAQLRAAGATYVIDEAGALLDRV